MNEISIIGACKIGLLSICLFGTHKSTLALIIRGSSLSDDVPAIFGLVVLLWENTIYWPVIRYLLSKIS